MLARRKHGAGTQCRTVALVAPAVWAIAVVAACYLADPVGSVAGHAGHRRRGHPARQHPAERPMAPLDWVAAAAVARFEVKAGEVRLKMEVSWHATVLQHSIATPHDSRRICSRVRQLKHGSQLP
jgi:hypothetical protein